MSRLNASARGSKVEGMNELVEKLHKMSLTPNKVGSKALVQAGKIVKKTEVSVAKRTHTEYSERVGFNAIKSYGVKKRGSTGMQTIDIGFKAKLSKSQKKKDQANKNAGKSRPTYWDKIKGLIVAPLHSDVHRKLL